jgi:RES domain-containing protein
MIVHRISSCKYISDLSGHGAYLMGGRWNSKGMHMLYTSEQLSMAMLETLVHIPSHLVLPNFCLIKLQIPTKSLQMITAKQLPKNWQQLPSIDELKKIGDAFLNENKYLALKVPSSILPFENNILLNPNHKLFSKIKILSKHQIEIDKRLIKTSDIF